MSMPVQSAQKRQVAAARILVVDDEESIRDLCARVLTRAGYAVKTVPSGEDAVTTMAEAAFDLLISDIRMPGMSGLEVLARAKTAYPHIRVVLITGFGTPQILTRGQPPSADRILTKPFSPTELLTAVRENLPPAG
ncbi:MAG TPA: response regulator [bacterium]